MEGKWFIIEEFGKIGPFTHRELLGGVERGDYDYSVRLESEQTGKRTNLTELAQQAKKTQSRTASKPDHKSIRQRSSRPVSRTRTSNRKIESFLKNSILMLTGSVVALGLFFFFKKIDLSQLWRNGKQQEPEALILDLSDTSKKSLSAALNNVTRISSLPKKTKQTVRIGPVKFSRKHLRRCKVKCRLLVTDQHGASVTAVFFAQSFRNKLIKSRGNVFMRGIVSAKGNEIYLQSLSYE